MNKEDLLRSYDALIGMLSCIDNQNRRSCFTDGTLEAIEQVRELIKDMKDVECTKSDEVINNG